MTIVCGVTTANGIIISSDSLITRTEGQQSFSYINKSKKIIEAKTTLQSYKKNETKEINMGIAFAGSVTLIDSLKSRSNLILDAENFNISFFDIVQKYIEIFNNILLDHIINRYNAIDFENENINKIINDINVEILFFGYCNKIEKYKIIEVGLNNFNFEIKSHQDNMEFYVIGTEKGKIRKLLINKIENIVKKSILRNEEIEFCDLVSLLNTEIMNIISDDKCNNIGGDLTSFIFIEKDKIIELIEFLPLDFYKDILDIKDKDELERRMILYSKCRGEYRKSGIIIKAEKVSISGKSCFNYNPNYLNKENYIKHQIETEYNKKRIEIYNFIGENNLKIKKINNKFKIFTYNNIDDEYLNLEWQLLTKENDGYNFYQNFLLNDLIKNTKLLNYTKDDFYIPFIV